MWSAPTVTTRKRLPPAPRWAPLCLLFLSICSGVSQAADPAPEDVVKAAVVYKLTRYVSWPNGSFEADDSPLRICSIGDRQVADALEVVEGRVVQGRRVEFSRLTTLHADDGCHVLFVGKRRSDRASMAASKAEELPILTISDGAGFADNGGIVELIRRDTRLGFRINVTNARAAQIVISAPLLELAEIVE